MLDDASHPHDTSQPSERSRHRNSEHTPADDDLHKDSLHRRLDRLWQDSPWLEAPSASDSDDSSDSNSGISGFATGELRHPQPVPPALQNLTIDRAIGSGGFGVVYRAFDNVLNRSVALKIPRAESLLDQEKLERFAEEAAIMARMDHPGIVRVYHAELSGPSPFIASQYCHGTDLAGWMQANPDPTPWRQAVALVAEIADAIAHAHEKGIVHRDLKPANILLTTRDASSEPNSNRNAYPRHDDVSRNHSVSHAGTSLEEYRAVLTDFGLAKFCDPLTTDTRSSLILGTPRYMAPERLDQSQSRQHGVAGDIYSLGVILFELLTHEVPFTGDSYIEFLDNIRNTRPIRLQKLQPDLPSALSYICGRCLEKNPDARYTTASGMADDLRRCLDGLPPASRSVSLVSRMHYWCTRPRRVADAGWYALWTWTGVSVFLTFNVMALPLHATISATEYSIVFTQGLLLFLISCVPMLWLAIKTIQGHRWAVWAVLGLTIFKLPLMIRPMFAPPIWFEPMFRESPVFSFILHSMLPLCLTVQLVLYACAASVAQPDRDSKR